MRLKNKIKAWLWAQECIKEVNDNKWICEICSHANDEEVSRCDICHNVKDVK